MTVPSTITKVHLDAATDDPKQARAELVSAIDAINTIIAHLNSSTILQNALGLGSGLSSSGGNVVVSAASTSAAGAVELATDAEAQTGTDTARAITPANLQAVTATETRKGVIELATNTEAVTGTDTARAVTPAGLAAKIASLTPAPTSASTSEVTAETATDEFIRPDRLRYSQRVVKAWGMIANAGSGSFSLVGGFNISSLSSSGSTINFTTAMSGTNYLVMAILNDGNETGAFLVPTFTKNTTSVTIARPATGNYYIKFIILE